MAKLIINLPDGRSLKQELSENVYVLGRDPGCDIVLDDPSASRRHVLMRFSDGAYVIEDLGSKNGTLVNDQPVEVRSLKHLDQILIGSVEVKYVDEPYSDASSTVVVSSSAAKTESASYSSRSSSLNLSQRRLQMLYDLSERLMTLRDRNALLEEAMTICFETLRFERGAIAVRKAGGRGVDWPVVRNLRGRSGELTISQSVLGRALDHGERAIVTDTADERVDPTVSMVQLGIRSAMCVPLKSEEEILGVIYGDRTTTGTQYSTEDVDFLAALARQVSIGLINGRLVDEQKAMLAMEKELALAREIQEGLFPETVPEHDQVLIAALNDPGRLVSGDYYDVLRFTDGRIGFLIADVTGKGVAASLLMSNLQAAVRLTLPNCTDLGALVGRWNELIYTNTDSTKFVTCLAAILDPEARKLTFCPAGHQLPYVVSGRGGPPRLLKAPADYPLGVVEGAEFRAHTVDLGPDPCIIFAYTDGVPEAMDEQQNEFGQQRMEDVLGGGGVLDPHMMIKRMRRAITAHCSDAAQSDDITMVAVRLS